MSLPSVELKGSLLSVARHEAAHAVIGESFGFRCRRVEIHSAERGVCIWDGRTWKGRGIIAHAVVALAGTAAEQLWHRMPAGYIRDDDGRGLLSMGFTMQDLAPGMSLAKRAVRFHKAAIWRVADALLESGALTGAQVRDLIGG